jgi:hypothetical protein
MGIVNMNYGPNRHMQIISMMILITAMPILIVRDVCRPSSMIPM